MENEFITQFREIYNTNNPIRDSELKELFPTVISSYQNHKLDSIPFPAEIKEALWDMHDLKATAMDGYPPLF